MINHHQPVLTIINHLQPDNHYYSHLISLGISGVALAAAISVAQRFQRPAPDSPVCFLRSLEDQGEMGTPWERDLTRGEHGNGPIRFNSFQTL